MKKEKFAIIGAGHFGSAIALSLAKRGAEVLVIDNNMSIVNDLADEVAEAVCIDVTSSKALAAENIQDFDTIIVAIGNDFVARLLCVANLIDLNVKRIICRCMGKNEKLILEKMGIKEFLAPEDEIGTLFAERLMNPNLITYLQLPDGYNIAEIFTPNFLIGLTLDDICFRENFKLSLITIRRVFEENAQKEITEEHIIGVPDYSEVIQKEDVFVIFGRTIDIDNFLKANQ